MKQLIFCISNSKKIPFAFLLFVIILFIYLIDINIGLYLKKKNNMFIYYNEIHRLFIPLKNKNITATCGMDLDLKNELPKINLTWHYDNSGYRNNTDIKNKEIIIIGDSFARGVCSTNQAIAEHIMNNTNKRNVYNYSKWNNAKDVLSNKMLKPKTVILILVERNIRIEALKLNRLEHIHRSLTSYLSILNKYSYFNRKELANIKDKVAPRNAYYEINNHRFLSDDLIDYSKQLYLAINQLARYKDILDKQNIKFLFVPIPNKSTLLQISNNSYNGFLNNVYKQLKNSNINYVDILEAFKPYTYQKLFWSYDTHPTPYGNYIIANAISTHL